MRTTDLSQRFGGVSQCFFSARTLVLRFLRTKDVRTEASTPLLQGRGHVHEVCCGTQVR
jgi:hypothetical protein